MPSVVASPSFRRLGSALGLTLVVVCFLLTPHAADAQQGRSGKGVLDVVVRGLRSDRGWMRCALWDRESGFPRKGGRQYTASAPSRRQATCHFTGLPPGIYAVASLHDENGDGKMEKNWLGIPKEGWAVSNNAEPGYLSPPSFQDARFRLNGLTGTIYMNVRY